jgi:CBS-domain-containing membrane protein
MSCASALVPGAVTVGPEQTIGDALGLLQQYGLRALPMTDDNGALIGRFNLDVVLSNLLPSAITVETHGLMDANLRLDFVSNGEEDIVERFRLLRSVKLADVMEPCLATVTPDTPLWEGIRQLFHWGSPIPVVEAHSQRLLGVLSVQSVMAELARRLAEREI